MSVTILVIGESGTGKSTSMRNLNAKETFIINVLGKPLPFKGYKKHYIPFSSENLEGNYYATDDNAKILRAIHYVDDKRPDIKTLIIDDFQYTMCNEFMRKAIEKGYEKFSIMAKNAWSIISELSECRNDLNCVVLSHSAADESGKMKCKTIGKMLDDKVVLEGMVSIVLHSLVNENHYCFLTQTQGNYMAKSPMGMFEKKIIDNDLAIVLEKSNEYFNEDVDQ